jgi:uncharacterized protein
MLLIEHFVGPSKIHGLGVFSRQQVRKGTLIWEFNPLIDLKISRGDLLGLPDHTQNWIVGRVEYYPSGDFFVLGADGDQFMNHSDEPNPHSDGLLGFSTQEILEGEEITCRYRQKTISDHYGTSRFIVIGEPGSAWQPY